MNPTFSVRLEGSVSHAAQNYLDAILYRDGYACFTKRGKAKQREEYIPVVEEKRVKLVELLELNYPEVIGRFGSVFGKSHHRETDEFYLQIERKQ